MDNEFIVPVGNVIKEYLEEYGISQKELSHRTGISEKHISNILNGKSSLTSDVALKLEKVMPEIPASYWMNLECKYQEYLAREKEKYHIEKENLNEIAKKYKFKEVFKGLDWSIEKQAYEMLRILGISDYSNFDATYNMISANFFQDGGEKEAIVVWMKLCENEVEIQNDDLEEIKYDEKNLKNNLELFKKIAYNPEVDRSLKSCRKLFNKLGVYFVIHEAIRNSKVRGVLTTYRGHPAIYISERFKTHDNIWFAIMHEVGHLLKHYNKGETSVDLDATNDKENPKEKEANEFARNFFINDEDYLQFVKQHKYDDKRNINEFAQKNRIQAGILVARLQHDGFIGKDKMNYLKIDINKNNKMKK